MEQSKKNKRKLQTFLFLFFHMNGVWYTISYLEYGDSAIAPFSVILNSFFLLLKEVQKVIRNQNFWVSGNCSSEHIFLEEFSRNWPKMTLSITFWPFVPELLHKLKNLDNNFFFQMAHICSSKQIFRTKN